MREVEFVGGCELNLEEEKALRGLGTEQDEDGFNIFKLEGDSLFHVENFYLKKGNESVFIKKVELEKLNFFIEVPRIAVVTKKGGLLVVPCSFRFGLYLCKKESFDLKGKWKEGSSYCLDEDECKCNVINTLIIDNCKDIPYAEIMGGVCPDNYEEGYFIVDVKNIRNVYTFVKKNARCFVSQTYRGLSPKEVFNNSHVDREFLMFFSACFVCS